MDFAYSLLIVKYDADVNKGCIPPLARCQLGSWCMYWIGWLLRTSCSSTYAVVAFVAT